MLNTLYTLLLQLPIGTRNPDDNSPIDLTSAFDVMVLLHLLGHLVKGNIEKSLTW